jgi:glycosyltransferase involved in cell wall biosynthesis
LSHILNCVYREGLSPVFNSQVLVPMRRLALGGVNLRSLIFAPVGELWRAQPRKHWGDLRKRLCEATGRSPLILPSPPSRCRRLWSDRFLLSCALSTVSQPSILHCRGSAMTYLALQARNRRRHRIIFDCRGLEHAEMLARGGPDVSPALLDSRAQALLTRIHYATGHSDAVICVSQQMADWMQTHAFLDASRTVVLPCAVDYRIFASSDADRQKIRASLGVPNRLVVSYCGSAEAWQCPDQCIEIFKLIRGICAKAFFLCLTTQPVAMQARLRNAALASDDFHVTHAPPEEVPAFLAAADVGLLIRQPSLLNRVASPVKFAEYLASGSPVLLSPGIGDYSDLVERESVGHVVSLPVGEPARLQLSRFIQSLQHKPQQIRDRCRTIASTRFDVSHYARRVASLYEELTDSARLKLQ